MVLLQNNKWPASFVVRGLLSLFFILWLASVMSQYEENPIEKAQNISAKPLPKNIVLEQLTLPPVPKVKPTDKPQTSKVPAVTEPVHQSPEPTLKQIKQTPPADKQQIEHVYKQLSDQGVDIQIAWPQQATLDFMYQCAGMQFAVLNGNILNKVNDTKANQLRLSDYSDWIRVAQGNLSKKEQHWLNAYALTGTAIRLFPREIDFRLSQHIANALKGSPLINLRASYQVINQTLLLNNIQLNNQTIKGSWELHQGKCS
jgi:cytoskeletal protein RodZ